MDQEDIVNLRVDAGIIIDKLREALRAPIPLVHRQEVIARLKRMLVDLDYQVERICEEWTEPKK